MALRVLLIDDDARLGELLGSYLAQHDVALVCARDGQAGLRALGGDASGEALLAFAAYF
jgi:DNA-binding response OmpR family regulator